MSQPSRASALQIAAPIPLAPPVTMAILPFRLILPLISTDAPTEYARTRQLSSPLRRQSIVAARRQVRTLGLERLLLHLLGRRPREALTVLDVTRDLEVGQSLFAPGQQRLGRARLRRLARREDYVGLDLLLADRVGHRDHGDIQNLRMRADDRFDLRRRDVLAAPPDEVLAAVHEVEIAFGVSPHFVAGVEPAPAPGLRGRLRVLEIFPHEPAPPIRPVGAAQHQL